MSQNDPSPGFSQPAPQPVVPLEYQAYTAAPSPRPSGLTAIAIIGICWAGLGLLCYGWGALWSVTALTISSTTTQADGTVSVNQWVMMEPPGGWVVNFSNMLVNLGLAGLLLAGSIAALRLRRWAPRALKGYALAAIAAHLIFSTVSIFYIIPETSRLMQQQMADQPGFAFDGTWFHWMQVVSAVVFLLVMMALPVAILYYLSRAHVKAVFAEHGS